MPSAGPESSSINPLTVLRALVAECGSQRAAALRLKISQAYLNDVLHKKRGVSDAMLQALGLARESRIRRKGAR